MENIVDAIYKQWFWKIQSTVLHDFFSNPFFLKHDILFLPTKKKKKKIQDSSVENSLFLTL